ncbi:MAG: UpxY family transcription antiterminator [Acidobacteriota bacterium]|nr:UpxY family transcription antiterminator [Acidobacteriota bacterium]
MVNGHAKLDPSHHVAPPPVEYLEANWYAAHTCARHEKRVAAQLSEKNVEHLLPLYETVHRWKDRRVKVLLPLFPGYVFVRIALRDRLQVLQIPSIVRLVGSGSRPVALPAGEIEALRNGLVDQVRVEPHPYLRVGRRVRIKTGPFQGLAGILKRKRGKSRLVLSVDLIMRSVSLDIDGMEVEPLPLRRQPLGEGYFQ